MPSYHLLYYPVGASDWIRIPLVSGSFSIGRTTENNLALNDEQVSRQHAAVFIDARGAWVMDLHATNGVLLNGQRIPPDVWQPLPPNTNFTIGATTLCVQVVMEAAPAAYVGAIPQAVAAQPAAAGWPQAKPRRKLALPLVILMGVLAFLCLAGAGTAAFFFLPGLLASPSKPAAATTQTLPPVNTFEVPKVVDSLSGAPGGDAIKDDQGVSLTVPATAVDQGQVVALERATLSQGMQQEIEKSYAVDSMAYAARLPAGEGAAGGVDLALPAKSPASRLAVLVDDQMIGILDTPAENGVFHINPGLALSSTDKVFSDPASGAARAPNRYLVVTPKTSGLYIPPSDGTGLSIKGGLSLLRGGSLSLLAVQADANGNSCVAEVLTLNHCWRNPDSSVYMFWKDDFPASLKDTEYLRVIDTINAVADMMSQYTQKGFTGAAISSSNPVYVVVEAGASEPYYSVKIGNVYLPWDIVASISDSKNKCTVGHELFHWVEAVHYYMIAAAISGPKSWWLEASAENGTFLLNEECINKNLTQYGLVNTNANVLGLQAAPFLWESGEQARYIQAQQFYISICEGGSGCALSQATWANAINSGTYPMEGSAQTAYEQNARDLGLYLLGTAPEKSRTSAAIPPATVSGTGYGDYLSLKTSPRGDWDYGLTMNQFTKVNDQKVKVEAKIAKGGVYPLWVSNGTGTPMGGTGGNTGLPGFLEIQPGPAFWLKKDAEAPVFYPEGKGLKLGPISNKLGVGKARIVAVAPSADQTFNAVMSLVDLSGDWSAKIGAVTATPVDCEGYKPSDDPSKNVDDTYLQLLSSNGAFKLNSSTSNDINLTWDGTLPEGVTATGDVKVEADKVILHYTIDIPKPADSTGWLLPDGIRASLPPAQPLAQNRSYWLSMSPVLPVLGAAAWLRRQKRKWARLGLVVLVVGVVALGALMLSGCFGLAIWGTMESTYTFNKLEYVGPQESTVDNTSTPTGVNWNLSNGQVVFDFNLKIEVDTTDSNGVTTTKVEPCVIKATSTATGTVGPDGSVAAPSNE